MSRLTLRNLIKVALVVLFFPFIAFLLLTIGIRRKNAKVLLEGALYAAIFLAGIYGPNALSPLLILGSMGISALRSYMLRDLWLHRRGQRPKLDAIVYPQPTTYVAPQQYMPPQASAPPVVPTPSSDDLSSGLAWVSSYARHNKHRLPAEAYVTVLETSQVLDSVIDAEKRQPSGDAAFEYELQAMVRDYLPAVIQGYLAIPSGMVDDRQPNGRTPNQELAEQLRLLSQQAEALYSRRHSHTLSDLTATGNFLRERLGHRQSDGFDFGIK